MPGCSPIELMSSRIISDHWSRSQVREATALFADAGLASNSRATVANQPQEKLVKIGAGIVTDAR
jgi:hypothetical protein